MKMPRAIPLLDIYEKAVRDTDAKVVMLCANNYPAKLAGNFGIDNLFYFNGLVRKKCKLNLVEVSDDFWGIEQLLFPEQILGDKSRKHFSAIEEKAREERVYFIAMGTGALFSYAYIKETDTAFFEFPKGRGQRGMLNIYNAYADFAAAGLGIQLYNGRRNATRNPNNFTEKIKLKDISTFIKDISIIDIGNVNFAGLDPEIQISKSEAMNLALALALNRYSLAKPNRVLQLVEQMQYAGMEPNTVEQVVRFDNFLNANLPLGYFGYMADNGHVGVRGTRITNNPNDYDLFEFAKAYSGPILAIHHNILFENEKQPGTKANLERDMDVQREIIKAKDMPYPNRIRGINEYILRAFDNPNIKLMIVSPEPKCNMCTNIERLASEVAEATIITADKIRATGKYQESKIIPFAFITKGHEDRLDNMLRQYIQN